MNQPTDFVLAFDFGGTKMAIATADRSGQRLGHVELPTRPSDGAPQALDRAVVAGHSLAEAASENGGTLLGIGVSTMGVTLEDSVVMAPNVPGWERQAIPKMMRRAFSTDSVRVANDVKAAARAEIRWGSLRCIDTGIYLNLGTGIGAALVVGGRVVEGAHGAAGEIGYNLRQLHQDEGAWSGRVPLEEFVGGGAIAARIARRFGSQATPDTVYAAIETSVEAREFVEEIMTEIAFHLSNLTIALDPSRISVAGGLMRSQDVVLPRLQAHVRRFVPFPPEVVTGSFLLDGGLMGGIALGLEAAGEES